MFYISVSSLIYRLPFPRLSSNDFGEQFANLGCVMALNPSASTMSQRAYCMFYLCFPRYHGYTMPCAFKGKKEWKYLYHPLLVIE